MTVHATGHWHGDPEEHCGELTVAAQTIEDSKALAVLYRVLKDVLREELLAAAVSIEEHALAGAEVAPGCRV